jgi:hypothetical protein
VENDAADRPLAALPGAVLRHERVYQFMLAEANRNNRR